MIRKTTILVLLTASISLAVPKIEPLGLKTTALVKEGKLTDAKKLLEAELNSHLGLVIHWRLAQIATLQKRYGDFRKHLEESLGLQLLKNPQVVGHLYNVLPQAEKKWLLEKVSKLIEPAPSSQCPFFEMTERKNRAQMLLWLLEGGFLKPELFYELYVLLPEAIDAEKLSSLDGFKEMYDNLSTADLVKRMELLLTFGQNEQAHKSYLLAVARLELSPIERCELDYVDAKIERKMRKYQKARESFSKLAEKCPDEIKVKARFMELTLIRMQNDDLALPKFDAFVRDYPKHSFTDDILLFKAGILFDKNRQDEAHSTLQQLIDEHPQGDMIGRALFLQGMSYFKQGQKKAINSFKKLEEISEKDSLDHASAVYWQARLSVYPKMKLTNPLKLSKTVQKKLEGLVKAKPPTVYSWLAYSLLSSLGKKTKFKSEKKSGRNFMDVIPEDKDLSAIKELIQFGFNEEALYLLDDLAVDEQQVKRASIMAIFYDVLGKAENGHQKLVRCHSKLSSALAQSIPDVFQRISYPYAYGASIDQVLDRIDLPKSLVYGIMRQESGFMPKSCSWAGAKGLMQLIYSSAKSQSQWWNVEDFKEEDLYHTQKNILLASSLLKGYWQKFGNMAVALCAYNAGPAAAKKWLDKNDGAPLDVYIEEIPFKETNTYVKTVLGGTFAYAQGSFIPQLTLALDQ